MFTPLILGALLLLGQKPEAVKPPQFGTIAGIMVGPNAVPLKQPFQVILMSSEYALLWTAGVQQRLDNSWERYKPVLAQKKELFFELSRQAYLDTLQSVTDQMRRDLGSSTSKFIKNTSPDGKFDFPNIPLGDYKVVAVGKNGSQQSVWLESVTLTSPLPQFVQLKKLP